jgi:hypothetical protein
MQQGETMKDRLKTIGIGLLALMGEAFFSILYLALFILYIPFFVFSDALLDGVLSVIRVPGLKREPKCQHPDVTVLFTDHADRYWEVKCNVCGKIFLQGFDD